jgi:hypothetical protein
LNEAGRPSEQDEGLASIRNDSAAFSPNRHVPDSAGFFITVALELGTPRRNRDPMLARCLGHISLLENSIAIFVSFKDLANLAIGFALLVLLILLVKEISGFKGNR